MLKQRKLDKWANRIGRFSKAGRFVRFLLLIGLGRARPQLRIRWAQLSAVTASNNAHWRGSFITFRSSSRRSHQTVRSNPRIRRLALPPPIEKNPSSAARRRWRRRTRRQGWDSLRASGCWRWPSSPRRGSSSPTRACRGGGCTRTPWPGSTRGTSSRPAPTTRAASTRRGTPASSSACARPRSPTTRAPPSPSRSTRPPRALGTSAVTRSSARRASSLATTASCPAPSAPPPCSPSACAAPPAGSTASSTWPSASSRCHRPRPPATPSASRRPSPSAASPWRPPQTACSASSTARTRHLHRPRGFLRPRSSRWWSRPTIRSRTTAAMRKGPRKTRGGWAGSSSAGPASYHYQGRYTRAPQTRTCRPSLTSSLVAGSGIAGRALIFEDPGKPYLLCKQLEAPPPSLVTFCTHAAAGCCGNHSYHLLLPCVLIIARFEWH